MRPDWLAQAIPEKNRRHGTKIPTPQPTTIHTSVHARREIILQLTTRTTGFLGT